MNKKLLLIICILMLSFLAAQAQMRMTVGLSGFMANYSFTDEDDDDMITTDAGLLFGPYLSIASDKLSLGASMYFGSFPITELFGEDIEDWDIDASVSRKDFNLSLGYALIQNAGLVVSPFVGLKHFTWDFSFGEGGYEFSWNRSGTMVGGGLQGVIKPSPTSGLYLYASGALLAGSITDEYTVDEPGWSESDEASSTTALFALNAGLGYRVPNSGLGINVGFRGDIFGSTEGETDEDYEEAMTYTEQVIGIVGTVSWTF
ncbi:hypothetical protein JXO59_07020 [candidate division KSB1 bacterium]|nr:hypothetical protein [candidate division KSB1 bacterium]